jgi:predicted acylesterase/phospholipase RssA
MFYGDLMQRFIPWPFGALDRSQAIEQAWQQAFEHLPGQPFAQRLDVLYAGCPLLPELLLNATRVETGERVVLTRLPTDRSLFVNTFDAMQRGSTTRTQSLAGLVHHSARFPLISPAGTVEIDRPPAGAPPSFRLVDGGYFDNSGVQTALEVIAGLQRQFGAKTFRPLLLVVRNSPEPFDQQQPHDAGASRLFPESGSIALALLNVRGSHAVTARGTALRLLGDDVIDLYVPRDQPEAPLGWGLSAASRKALDAGARRRATEATSRISRRIAAGAGQ